MKNKRHNKKVNNKIVNIPNKINFNKLEEYRIEYSCRLLKELKEEIKELREKNKDLIEVIISTSLFQKADEIKDIKFKIYKERFNEKMQYLDLKNP